SNPDDDHPGSTIARGSFNINKALSGAPSRRSSDGTNLYLAHDLIPFNVIQIAQSRAHLTADDSLILLDDAQHISAAADDPLPHPLKDLELGLPARFGTRGW